MKKFYTILIAILLILSYVLVYQTGKEKTLDWAIEEQQKIEQRHLETLNEFTTSYNELYQEFNNLYQNYLDERVISWDTFTITAYSLNDPAQGTNDICAVGLNLETWDKIPVVAVDPAVIPLYSIVEIESLGGFIAIDTGGLIKGKRIDVLMDSKEEAQEFGVKNLKVRVIK